MGEVARAACAAEKRKFSRVVPEQLSFFLNGSF
jgi:hypothetical protein